MSERRQPSVDVHNWVSRPANWRTISTQIELNLGKAGFDPTEALKNAEYRRNFGAQYSKSAVESRRNGVK